MGTPKECKMPDLSGLDFPLIGPLLIQLLMGEPGLSQNARLYRRNFVRLVDKALREYHEAREAIIAQIAEAKRPAKEMAKHGRQIFTFQFTDHIETCINAISRLFKLLERIKAEKEAPAFPRELRRLIETKSESIADVRDAVEHIDERIQNGMIAPGKPIMLAVTENDDGVMIANYEIKFEELAMVLKKMHEIALYILTAKKMEAA
jgi:hypothetical protein